MNPYIPKRPHPNTGVNGPSPKQMEFLLLSDREAFYGGAAGGGKSDALLMGALMYVDVPRYAGILFRKTLADHQLPEGLIPRMHQWAAYAEQRGYPSKWNGSTATYTFPTRDLETGELTWNDPSTVSFGYMKAALDHFRYQSSAYQYIGFDETGHFLEEQYRYMFSRLRRLQGSHIPLRLRGAGNPGGVGHEWVKRRFINPETAIAPFIPAKLEDNAFLDFDEYVESLNELDPITFRQLRYGDWEAYSSGMFERDWFDLVPRAPRNLRAVRYWDLAATDPSPGHEPDWTAGALVTVYDGIWYICDMVRIQGSPGKVENLIRLTAKLDDQRVEDGEFSSIVIYMEQEGGASGKSIIDHYAKRILVGHSFRPHSPTGNKVFRAGPVSSAAEKGNLLLVKGKWNSDFIDEAVAFPEGKKDQVDTISGAFAVIKTMDAPKGRRGKVA